MSERAALLLLDSAMERYEVTRDDVRPIISMKLAVVLDDTDDRLQPVFPSPENRS